MTALPAASGVAAASLRRYLYESLWPRPAAGLRPITKILIGAILLSVATSILLTEPLIAGHARAGPALRLLEAAFFALFAVEYALRLWAIGEDRRFAGLLGRLRYARRPMALLDLVVVLAFALTYVGADAFLLRLARLVRVVAVLRLGEVTVAGEIIFSALRRRRYELTISLVIGIAALILAAALLHYAEGSVQPDSFGSIPRAMWWAVVTLTTIGYGDVFPVTLLGRMLATVIAVLGIGVIAIPTGIMAAALSEAFQRARTEPESMPGAAEEPHED